MVARRPFKLPGVREYLEEVKQVTAEIAAKEIVADLNIPKSLVFRSLCQQLGSPRWRCENPCR